MDRQSKDVRTRMWKKMQDSPFLMIGLVGGYSHSEPMTAQLDKDADSKFWFYTSKSNRVAGGGPAMAQFVSKDHKLFACIKGTLTEEADRAVFDAHWNTQAEAWFEGGRNDPDLMMLRFDLGEAEIWEGDESLMGKLKMMTGQTIRSGEAGRHAMVDL